MLIVKNCTGEGIVAQKLLYSSADCGLGIALGAALEREVFSMTIS